MNRRVSLLYRAALLGREPAESLSPDERVRLIHILWMRRWTDLRIAEHTRWTTYTVARIRDRIGLPANHETKEVA